MNTAFLDINLTRTLPRWLLCGSCKNLHDCINTLVISGTSLSSSLTFQHILHCSTDFKLVSDFCYSYPCWWWCTKFNPPRSLNFNNILPQYIPNDDVEQSDILSGLLLMDYHWWYVQNSMNTGFLDTNLTRTLPQWLLWGSCKNLHDCNSILVISGTSLSSAPTFQHILHCSTDFKLVSDSCYCYLLLVVYQIQPSTSLNFNNILHFPITLQEPLMFIEW